MLQPIQNHAPFSMRISQSAPAEPGAFAAAMELPKVGPAEIEAYKARLERRFGPVTVKNVSHDPAELEALGKQMNGNDIVIAPNILEQMASDPQAAAYYERKIQYFFTDVIPNGQAFASARGLTFEPCGVVIHPDGTVTYICGGGDSPEKVAKVAAENRARREKEAAQRREYFELAAEAAARRRALWQGRAEAPTGGAAFAGWNAPAGDGAAICLLPLEKLR